MPAKDKRNWKELYNLGMETNLKPKYAQRFLRLALEKCPTPKAQSVIHVNLGIVCHSLNKNRTAIGHYRCAIDLNKSFWKAYYNLGKALMQESHLMEATSHLETTLKLNPEFTPATEALAEIQSRLEQDAVRINQELREERAFELAVEETYHIMSSGLPETLATQISNEISTEDARYEFDHTPQSLLHQDEIDSHHISPTPWTGGMAIALHQLYLKAWLVKKSPQKLFESNANPTGYIATKSFFKILSDFKIELTHYEALDIKGLASAKDLLWYSILLPDARTKEAYDEVLKTGATHRLVTGALKNRFRKKSGFYAMQSKSIYDWVKKDVGFKEFVINEKFVQGTVKGLMKAGYYTVVEIAKEHEVPPRALFEGIFHKTKGHQVSLRKAWVALQHEYRHEASIVIQKRARIHLANQKISDEKRRLEKCHERALHSSAVLIQRNAKKVQAMATYSILKEKFLTATVFETMERMVDKVVLDAVTEEATEADRISQLPLVRTEYKQMANHLARTMQSRLSVTSQQQGTKL